MMYRYIAELKAENPSLELSGLVGRILAIVVNGGQSHGQQIGQASGFHLKWVTWPDDGERRIGLCCRVEIDQAKYDAMKPDFLEGGVQLFVGEHQILWCAN